MNLKKSNWEKATFGDVVIHSNAKCDPKAEGIERFVAGEHLITDDLRIRNWGSVKDEFVGPAFHRKFLPGQILYGSRRTYLRKVAVADFTGVCANTTFVLIPKPEKIDAKLLPFIIQSPRFTKHSIDNSKGSTNPFINYKDIAKYTFLLPPKPEQEKILSVFLILEQLLEQAEQQEKNLKKLQNKLSNGLVSPQPLFGNLLNKKNCTPTTFGETAECDKAYPEHKKAVSRFVGLEFIEAENFQLQGWGDVSNGTTFTKRFSKGDVLFGKRRAYLKKVAVADFDGICSGDILVLRAKEKMMLTKLLPFYVSAEKFIQHAVSTSAGSLSPRTKWKDLSLFEIAIPDLRTQEKIVDVFQQLQTTLDQIKTQKQTLKNLKQKLLNEILG